MADLFVAAVEAIYDAAPEPSRWPDALDAIAAVFDDVGTVLVYQRDDGGFGAIASPCLQPMLTDFAENFHGADLRALRGIERGIFWERDAVTDRHVVSAEEMATHPYYLMMARHHLRYFAGVPVSPDPRLNIAISVQRSGSKVPYTDAELKTMTRLGRHAEKALRLSIRLFDADLGTHGLRSALGRLGIGVFALDSLSRVVFSNAAADRLLGDQISVRQGRLRIGSGTARESIDRAIDMMVRGDSADLIAEPKPILLHRASSQQPLVLYLLPVASTESVEQFLTHTRVIVLVVDPKAGEPPDATLVRDVLGLTLGEARVAALVGSGIAPREAARKLGIAEETARSALKRVFSKVGVSRQSELTALLGRLALR